MCREKTLRKINKEAEERNKTQKILVQLYISNNTNQNGLDVLKAEAFCKKIYQYTNIKLIGLMTIATNTTNTKKINGDFQELYNIYELLNKEPKKWEASKPIEVTRPEFEWEGANLPIQYSSRSSINTPVNQLRDPCVFQDEGKLYLLYSVKGENGIAISTLEIN